MVHLITWQHVAGRIKSTKKAVCCESQNIFLKTQHSDNSFVISRKFFKFSLKVKLISQWSLFISWRISNQCKWKTHNLDSKPLRKLNLEGIFLLQSENLNLASSLSSTLQVYIQPRYDNDVDISLKLLPSFSLFSPQPLLILICFPFSLRFRFLGFCQTFFSHFSRVNFCK